jgi:hypothetical protein
MDLGIDKFDTKKELFKYLIENKKQLISMKKSALKVCDIFDSNRIEVTPKSIFKNEQLENDTSIVKTIIGNTYNWMDSHDDVHLKNTFTKSISDRQKDIFHLHDHKFEITAKVGEPQKIYEQDIAWKTLGINKSGNTQALVMESEVLKDYNSKIFKAYKTGKINQHSVGMQYIKIDLAINDESEEEEFKVWNDNLETIANKDRAEERGFFWAVKEAKLVEISAVLMGSNELTPTLDNKTEPLQDTQKTEAAQALQTTEEAQALQLEKFYKTLKIK